MIIGFLKNTDDMKLEDLYKTKNDWTNKINKIKKFQTRLQNKGQTNAWIYKKNHNWIMAAEKQLEELNQVIQLQEMKLP